jgi:hypothetical protein
MAKNIVTSTRASLFDPIKSLSSLEQQAIVLPQNPPPGMGGFLFDISLDDSVDLVSEITDHFVEQNSAIQDNIALRPETITVSGLVAELSSAYLNSTQMAEKIEDRLPNFPAFEPEFSPAATLQIGADDDLAESDALGQTSAGSLYEYYFARSRNQPDLTKQNNAFQYFNQLWLARQIFTVETPWGIFTDMAIQTLRAEQDENTRYVSNFTITFKRIRFAQEITINAGQLAGRAATDINTVSEKGGPNIQQVTPESKKSILARALDAFRNP